MTRAAVVFAIAFLVLGSGCGGGSSSPADEVTAAVKDLTENARAHRWGDYCAATTDPAACTDAIATLEANGVDMAELVPSEELLDRMRVTVKGDRATVDATAADDAVYVKRGDRWLFLWPVGAGD